MKQVDESRMRDVKASIAVGAADLLPKPDRPAFIAQFLRVDEDEARALISRGRVLARRKSAARQKGEKVG